MRESIGLYNTTTGINNKVHHSSASWSPEVTQLVDANNVRVSDSGKLETLPGPTQVSSLNFNSVYQDSLVNMVGDTLGDIYTVNASDVLVKIGQGFDGTALRFQRFGNKLFICTDSDLVHYSNNLFASWVFSPNLDAELDVELSGPFSGSILSKFKDRFIICLDNTAYFSQSLNPYAYSKGFDYISLNSPITFCHEFEDELLLGSATELFAIEDATTSPKFRKLLPCGAFQHTGFMKVLPEIFKCFIMLTHDGMYAYNTQQLMTKLSPTYNFPEYSCVDGVLIPNTNFVYLTGG